MREKFIEECALIQQNCLYTAEAHHDIALSAKRKALWLQVIPAVCAALAGTLAAAGIAQSWLLPFTVLSSTVAAVTAVLNPTKAYQDHLSAAKDFTSLKHDARFLREARSANLADDALAIAVENLHQRYTDLPRATPPTDPKSFAAARKTIQAGLHDPDRGSSGEVK